MLFNEDDEEDETEKIQKNILVTAEKIDKKSNDLSEKLNNLLVIDNANKKKLDDKSFSKENKDQQNKNKENLKQKKNLGLFVLDEAEEETDDIIFNNKSSNNKAIINNKKDGKKNENINLPNKNEIANVFEDIFTKNPIDESNKVFEFNENVNNKINQNSILFDEEILKKDESSQLINFEKNANDVIESNNNHVNINKAQNNDLFDVFKESIKNQNNESNERKIKSNKKLDFLLDIQDEEAENIKFLNKFTLEDKTDFENDNFKDKNNLYNKENKIEEIDIKENKFESNLDIDKIASDKNDCDSIKINDMNQISKNLTDNLVSELLNKEVISDNTSNNFNKNQEFNQNLLNDNSKSADILNKENKENNTANSKSEEKLMEKDQENQLLKNELDFMEDNKNVRNITNTMINADNLPGLESTNTQSKKANINFTDFENEEVNKTNDQNSNNKLDKQTKQIKQNNINYEDPLKPIKKKTNKPPQIKHNENLNFTKINKSKNSLKNVFEDSEEEEEKQTEQKTLSPKNNQLSESLINKEENQVKNSDIHIKHLEEVLTDIKQFKKICDENKEIQYAINQDKKEEKRKSIKVNKFSEIQKVFK